MFLAIYSSRGHSLTAWPVEALAILAALWGAGREWVKRGYGRRLNAERMGETYADFVRAFAASELDPQVIKAVHEEVQAAARAKLGMAVPLRAADDLRQTLKIPGRKMRHLVAAAAKSSGRTLHGPLSTEAVVGIVTPADLAQFLCTQPRRSK